MSGMAVSTLSILVGTLLGLLVIHLTPEGRHLIEGIFPPQRQ